jgi:TctA family transporter
MVIKRKLSSLSCFAALAAIAIAFMPGVAEASEFKIERGIDN